MTPAQAAPSSLKLVHVVAALLINAERQFLLAQRPEGKFQAGRWELPGGKLEAGELPEDALVREIQEELGITLDKAALTPFTFISHSYAELGVHVLMPIFSCTRWHGTPKSMENQSFEWVSATSLRDYQLVTADEALIEPIQSYIKHQLPA
jgi:8-oxo-dGTP diphosphatase